MSGSKPPQVFRFDCVFSDAHWRHAQDDISTALPFQPKLQAAFVGLSKKFVYQLERGLDTGRIHYQCHLSRKTKCTAANLARDLRNLLGWTESGRYTIHVGVASSAGETALRSYCMKKDATYRAGPWSDQPITEPICPEYKGEDILPTIELRDWQRELVAELTDPDKYPAAGQVMWYYDQHGGKGKTSFLKYLAWHHKANVLGYARAGDLAHNVVQAGARKIYAFDLVRTKPLDIGGGDLYSFLESLANGYVLDHKYQGGVLRMFHPYVVVFSNQLPDFSNLSEDRWVVVDMKDFPVVRDYRKRTFAPKGRLTAYQIKTIAAAQKSNRQNAKRVKCIESVVVPVAEQKHEEPDTCEILPTTAVLPTARETEVRLNFFNAEYVMHACPTCEIYPCACRM